MNNDLLKRYIDEQPKLQEQVAATLAGAVFTGRA